MVQPNLGPPAHSQNRQPPRAQQSRRANQAPASNTIPHGHYRVLRDTKDHVNFTTAPNDRGSALRNHRRVTAITSKFTKKKTKASKSAFIVGASAVMPRPSSTGSVEAHWMQAVAQSKEIFSSSGQMPRIPSRTEAQLPPTGP